MHREIDSCCKEIDPFTFFGVFNRGITFENKMKILEAIKIKFGMVHQTPINFSGVPVLHNMKSWFFPYSDERNPSDIDKLWDVFVEAQSPEHLQNPSLKETFDRALEVRNTNFNLTMGLFWIRPSEFVSLDSYMREHLRIDLPRSGMSFDFYEEVINGIKRHSDASFPEISRQAWTNDDQIAPTEIDINIGYWLVGAFGGTLGDQTSRFREGLIDYSDHVKTFDLQFQMTLCARPNLLSHWKRHGGYQYHPPIVVTNWQRPW